MKNVLLLLIHLLTVIAKLLGPGGIKGIIAENLLLKQQLLAVCRPRQRAPNLLSADRFVFGFLSLFLRPGRIMKTAVGVQPSTLLRFHDYLVRRKYRALCSPHRRDKPGPKGPSQELIPAIVELKRRNPRFGYPRIARVIPKTFGLEIDRNAVRRVLAKYYHPDDNGNGPSWLTFIGHMKDSLWSVDLFRCESITLKSHWVMWPENPRHRVQRLPWIGPACHRGVNANWTPTDPSRQNTVIWTRKNDGKSVASLPGQTLVQRHPQT